jgi:D-alanine-D-alanine ligase
MARVLLLFGGRSAEHEVSCSSAVSVHDALEAAGHRVVAVGIDRDGDWYLPDTSQRPFRAEGRSVRFSIPSGELRVGDDAIATDVVFPVLHGPKGEDGSMQGVFEISDLAYVGCGVLGSALAMDKDLAKRVVADAGVATAPWVLIDREAWTTDAERMAGVVQRKLSFPVFVKPVAQGSSIGIARASTAAELTAGVSRAFRYDDRVVVEQGIEGREIEVAVLDGPRASAPGEVVVADGWYTYDAKYADESSRFEAPADLSPTQAERVRGLAEAAFTALSLDGLARVDFFLDSATGDFLFNEANTMPGFTSISGFPKMWMASGLSYPQLCDHLVQAALKRQEARAKLAIR